MIRKNKEFRAYLSTSLSHGDRVTISDDVYLNLDEIDISGLISKSTNELETMKNQSIEQERSTITQIEKIFEQWEQAAANTGLLEKVIEYTKINETMVKHTSNQWIKNEYGNEEISNGVYRMCFRTYEETQYNRETKENEPVSWTVTWWLSANNPTQHNVYSIAGQDRKKFTDKNKAISYITGRKTAYQHLFTELFPPLPPVLVHVFTVNGQLLNGYIVGENVKGVN